MAVGVECAVEFSLIAMGVSVIDIGTSLKLIPCSACNFRFPDGWGTVTNLALGNSVLNLAMTWLMALTVLSLGFDCSCQIAFTLPVLDSSKDKVPLSMYQFSRRDHRSNAVTMASDL